MDKVSARTRKGCAVFGTERKSRNMSNGKLNFDRRTPKSQYRPARLSRAIILIANEIAVIERENRKDF